MLLLGLVDVPVWLLLCLVIIASLWLFFHKRNQYFKDLGIPGPKPWPLVGNVVQMIQRTFMKFDLELKKEYGNLVGTFMGPKPILLVFDKDMLMQITVKDFHNFTNRATSISGEKLFDYSLLFLEDEEWKKMRSVMSPTFTTGKLKMMSAEINRCAKEFAESLTAEENFEAKDCSGAFTLSVIASTAFGLNIKCQGENREESPFTKHGKGLMNMNFKNPLFWLMAFFPALGRASQKVFGRSLWGREHMDFFREVLRQTIENKKKESNKMRADFIQLMVNAKDGQDIRDEADKKAGGEGFSAADITTDHILGNAFVFFLAGYETTAVTLSLLLYSLATNQDCQEKVYDEIQGIIGDEDDVDYSKITQMHYLDQCLNESLRMYPPAPRIDRVARNDVVINGTKIPKGLNVHVPVYALHNDPEVWNEPEKYDPDRYSPEEKAKRHPLTWMPFGFGPRNCIGLRLAMFEIKVAIVQILRKHKIVTCEKTTVPIVFDNFKYLKAKDGLWLKLEKRE